MAQAPRTLLLIRHPHADVAAGVCYGRLDLGLRADAEPAVREIAAAIDRRGIRLIWSSPARRCLEPARVAARRAGAVLRVDERLQELGFGAWEGVRWEAVGRSALDAWAADPLGFSPPGGESGAALLARVSDFHRALCAAATDCAVIAHGGPLRILHALARGQAPDLLAPSPPCGAVIALTVPP